eukprot:gene24713-31087_t
MGGAVHVPGNIDTLDNVKPEWNQGPAYMNDKAGEWNIFIDPVAAQVVFDTNIPITLVPLDACRTVTLDAGFASQITANDPLARFAQKLLELWAAQGSKASNPVPIFDPLATLIAVGDVPADGLTGMFIEVNTSEDVKVNLCGQTKQVPAPPQGSKRVQPISVVTVGNKDAFGVAYKRTMNLPYNRSNGTTTSATSSSANQTEKSVNYAFYAVLLATAVTRISHIDSDGDVQIPHKNWCPFEFNHSLLLIHRNRRVTGDNISTSEVVKSDLRASTVSTTQPKNNIPWAYGEIRAGTNAVKIHKKLANSSPTTLPTLSPPLPVAALDYYNSGVYWACNVGGFEIFYENGVVFLAAEDAIEGMLSDCGVHGGSRVKHVIATIPNPQEYSAVWIHAETEFNNYACHASSDLTFDSTGSGSGVIRSCQSGYTSIAITISACASPLVLGSGSASTNNTASIVHKKSDTDSDSFEADGDLST